MECIPYWQVFQMLSHKKYDRYGNHIRPGDICTRSKEDRVEYVIYKGEVFGSKTGKGEFGRFLTVDGQTSLKYTSVVFAFDPLSKRRPTAKEVTRLIKKFYEKGK